MGEFLISKDELRQTNNDFKLSKNQFLWNLYKLQKEGKNKYFGD